MILLVDKDPISADSIAYYLETEGFEVRTTFDPRATMTEVRTLRPELVLLEIILAGTNGLSLCRELKENEATRNTPVIVVSVIEAQARARDAGADGFLLKPVESKLLLEAVREVLTARTGGARD